MAFKSAEEEKKSKTAEDMRKKKADTEAANLAKAQVPTDQYFRTFSDKYSEYDEAGMPTKHTDGTEVNKSQKKKLAKDLQKHEKLRKKYNP
jgi:cysteinyl-tRNA synthetase